MSGVWLSRTCCIQSYLGRQTLVADLVSSVDTPLVPNASDSGAQANDAVEQGPAGGQYPRRCGGRVSAGLQERRGCSLSGGGTGGGVCWGHCPIVWRHSLYASMRRSRACQACK